MITPENRTIFLRRGRAGKKIALALAIAAFIALSVVGAFALFSKPSLSAVAATDSVLTGSVKDAWGGQAYDRVIELATKALEADPFDFTSLIYRGFARFYFGLSQPDYDAKMQALAASTIDLRRALVLEPFRQNGDIFYILGKAYYHRGYFYQELARDYLQRASKAGYKANDLNEYLGLVSSELGDTAAAIAYFKKALDEDPRDIVLLSLATAFVAIDDYTTAMGYVERIISSSKDVVIVQKARFVRGDLLGKLGRPDDAITEYETILRDNPNSADAHFFLGEVYSSKGDAVKARAQWREAYNIDPKHGGALSRLNS